MEMDWNERFDYLMEIRKTEEKVDEIEQKEQVLVGFRLKYVFKNQIFQISTRNQQRLEAGEMVYARNFHGYLDIYGEDFRRKIDINYGRNMLKQGENLRKFVVDCRFLRDFSVVTQQKFTKFVP